MRYRINFVWDADARVWVATSKDVPGLVLESPSFDRLVSKVKKAVPELVSLNGQEAKQCTVSITTKREETLPAYG